MSSRGVGVAQDGQGFSPDGPEFSLDVQDFSLDVQEYALDAMMTLEEFVALVRGSGRLVVTPALRGRLKVARGVVQRALDAGDKAVYGLTTGVGAARDERVAERDQAAHNERMITAHAVAVGPEASEELARATVLARICGLARGGSGISPAVLSALVDMFNAGVTPVMHLTGSLGEADLGALAEAALVLIGKGEATVAGRRLPGAQALAVAGLAPVRLAARDGLALLGANSLSAAASLLCAHGARRWILVSEQAAALSFVAYGGHQTVLGAEVLRPCGPVVSAVGERMRALLAGFSPDARGVQDPLSFRCFPHVHAMVATAATELASQALQQVNQPLDNPLVLVETGDIVSNGNFSGTALALAGDAWRNAAYRSLAMAERRTAKLLDSRFSGLSAGLSRRAGDSGLDILHYTALGIAADALRLAQITPVQQGVAAQGVEDYGSMAATSAQAALLLLRLCEEMTALEAVAAADAIGLRGGLHAVARDGDARQGDGAGMRTAGGQSEAVLDAAGAHGDVLHFLQSVQQAQQHAATPGERVQSVRRALFP